MQRRPMPELLDTDSGTPREVADSLKDLRWFNRWFGGIATVREMLDAVMQKTTVRQLSILEVASGEGYLPKILRDEFARRNLSLNFTLFDRSASHLPANGSSPKLAGDALQLPFQDASFDVVSCSLFAHHLAPDQVVQYAREALRVSRMAVLVHDLIRHPLHLAFAYAGVPLYRSRITRNDAPASVWQAYTVGEMKDFLRSAGAANSEIRTRYFFRMGAIAWKDATSR